MSNVLGDWSVGLAAEEKVQRWKEQGIQEPEKKSFFDFVAAFFAWLGSLFGCGSRSNVNISKHHVSANPPAGEKSVKRAVGQVTDLEGKKAERAAQEKKQTPAQKGRPWTLSNTDHTRSPAVASEFKKPSGLRESDEDRARRYIERIDRRICDFQANGTGERTKNANNFLLKCRKLENSIRDPYLKQELKRVIIGLRSTIQYRGKATG